MMSNGPYIVNLQVAIKNSDDIDTMYKGIANRNNWCVENCKGIYSYAWGIPQYLDGYCLEYSFVEKQDALMFKLVCG